ncbi:MAG: RraA family protein [Vicinamibacterales bacterium]|mgnify:CR=1 FL=1|nr:RraA family protein [Vicinamibacterales bacterium]MDP6607650.1 RraA family protein [Vicinamibacterales bacterium]MDP7295040.1 RraA family protein [Vicinamibacterales bacterium]MDP7473260.1 RraA family protein [Vicinamibacterales bacterium]MDP7671330.1 RraA family protein [Vicinamibacterales bacterium]
MTDRDGVLDAALVTAAAAFSSATLHEAASQVGALPAAIKPVATSMRLYGPACTVAGAPGDNLWLHRAMAQAKPGDVLVATVAGAYEFGYWGGIMTTAAIAGGLGGLVIDGCVRDGDELAASGFPVFARGRAIRGTAKVADAPGSINEPVVVGDVTVAPGDLVVGDADGVVVLARDSVGDVLAAARTRDKKEASIADALRQGRTTLDVYGWK